MASKRPSYTRGGTLRRKFGDKWYMVHGSYAKKSDAKAKAEAFRCGGNPARVVYEDGYWVVYWRHITR